MPAYAMPPQEPATLTETWQPTGRTRLRSAWFGLLVVETEQAAMIQTAARANGLPSVSWQVVKRWRRARRGHLVTIGADIFGAFMRGKAERH